MSNYRTILCSFLTSAIMLFVLLFSFDALNVYADCPVNNPNCIVFDDTSSGYVIGHGARITIQDNSNNAASVQVTITNGQGQSIILTYYKDPNTGYYVRPDYLMLTGSQTCSAASNPSCDPPNLSVALGQSIKASYGASVSSPQSIVSDNPGTAWPYPNPGPQPDTSAIIQCGAATGRAGSSGDYICDDWKTIDSNGKPGPLNIPYGANGVTSHYTWACSNTDSNGPFENPPIDYPCPSKNHKDVYVEIDWMQNHGPSQTALKNIMSAYKKSGIYLHLLLDEEIPHKASISGPGGADTDYNNIKKVYFGTASERSSCPGLNLNPQQCNQYISNILTAKRQVFHYALFGHSQSLNPTSSGLSEVVSKRTATGWGAANDMLISLGAFSYAVGSQDQQGGTFMHELGHNLDLGHGGPYPVATDPDVNCKPNYLSVMSYTRQFSDLIANRPIDYSHDPNLALWMKFENNYLDSSGFKNDGSAQGSTTFVAGKIGQAVNVVANSFVSVPDAPSLDIQNQITVSAWINAANYNNNGIVEKGAPTNQYVLFVESGVIKFQVNTSGGWSNAIGTTNLNTLPNQWIHVVGTYDGSTVSVYLNGKLEGTGTVTGTINTNTGTLQIGSLQNGAYQFVGSVDDVMIYNTALSAAQVSTLFSQQQPNLWMKFNNDATDSSGFNNNGALNGNPPPTYVAGKTDRAVRFTQSGSATQFVSVPDAPSLDIQNQITVSAWINAASYNNGYGIVEKGTNPSQYVLFVEGNVIKFQVHPSGGWVNAAGTTNLNTLTNQWIHVVGTYDGSTVSVYLNGKLEGTGTTSGTINGNSGTLQIGSLHGGVYPFVGSVDDVMIYNTALSAAQVVALYNQQPTNLWMKFNNDATDSSGFNNNGALNGNPPPTYVAGKTDLAVQFATQSNAIGSTTPLVSVPDAPSLDIQNQITVSAWINAANYNNNGIVEKGAPTNQYVLFVESGVIKFQVVTSGGSNAIGTTNLNTLPNQWIHVVGTYDGSTVSVYLNGKLEGTGTTSGTINTNSGTLQIGSLQNGVYPFVGSVDDVMIYNTALSAAQVAELAQTSVKYDYILDENAITENPVTGNSNQYTTFALSGGGFSSAVQANLPVDWDVDPNTESPSDTEPSLLLHSGQFTAGMPNPVTVTCPTDNKKALSSWDDWDNLQFDMTVTSLFATGAGGGSSQINPNNTDYLLWIIIALVILAIILTVLLFRKYKRNG